LGHKLAIACGSFFIFRVKFEVAQTVDLTGIAYFPN